jgi:hypothetical protein
MYKQYANRYTLYAVVRSTTVEKALQIHPFMQNKANFRNDKMSITIDMTSIYKILYPSPGPKNKPNSNPIQTQFKPKQSQFKPISKPNKPNQSQFQRKGACTDSESIGTSPISNAYPYNTSKKVPIYSPS